MITNEMAELLKALADNFKASEEYVKYIEAEKKYNASTTINSCLTEYAIQQQALSDEFAKKERDEDVCNAIQGRIEELYDTIVNDPDYEAYKTAGDEYSNYYKEIIAELDYYITGKRASCSGDCSSCGGCH